MTMTAATPVRRVSDGITVAVRLTPKSSADRIDGLAAAADGSTALKARVTAPPEGGKANAALLHLLATRWKLPKSALSVAAGAKDRRKIVHIAGDPEELVHRVAALLSEHHG